MLRREDLHSVHVTDLSSTQLFKEFCPWLLLTCCLSFRIGNGLFHMPCFYCFLSLVGQHKKLTMVSHWSSIWFLSIRNMLLPVYQEVACLVLGQLVPPDPCLSGFCLSSCLSGSGSPNCGDFTHHTPNCGVGIGKSPSQTLERYFLVKAFSGMLSIRYFLSSS